MQLTRRGDYAVRVMTDLAARAGSGPVPRIAIQARQRIPGAYLAKVVQALARAGLVQTRRGVHGGVSLRQPAVQVTLRRVIEAVEGPIHLDGCRPPRNGSGRPGPCPAHPVWRRLQTLVTRELETVTIADLVPGRVRRRGSRAAGVLVPWTA